MLATFFGMAPLCFVQSALSDDLFRRFPTLIYPLLGLCGVYLVAATLVLRRQFARPCVETKHDERQTAPAER